MSRALGRRASRAWLIYLALIPAACAGTSSTQTGAGRPGQPGTVGRDSAPPRDTYTGSIVSGTGAYAGQHARVKIYLHPRGSGESRPVRLVLIAGCGSSSGSCVRLSGTLHGTLRGLARGLPDTGREYRLNGSGRVGPLGPVRVSGEVAGTGFISRAQLLLKLTLSGSSGKMTIVARSGVVKGFTSP